MIAALARSNDLILFNVSDPLAEELPENLKMTVSDGELQAELDADAGATRQRVAEMLTGRVAEVFSWGRKYGVPVLPLTTSEPALDQILRLLGHLGPSR